jgi:hypothetical protein
MTWQQLLLESPIPLAMGLAFGYFVIGRMR